jgi:hypothetical protein
LPKRLKRSEGIEGESIVSSGFAPEKIGASGWLAEFDEPLVREADA